jgi:HEAT repeat protein
MMKGIAMVVVAALGAGHAENAPIVGIAPAPLMVVEKSYVTHTAQQDPSDAAYRAAGDAMSRGDYTRAAEMYGDVVRRYPTSKVAESAAYYQAFALYRIGGTDKLRAARDVLVRNGEKYPGLAKGEPAALRTRICGELARRGDEECAAEVAAKARATEGAATASNARAAAGARPAAGCPAEDDENDERIAALNALLQMDAERAMPVLTRVLERRDACSAGLRKKAVFLVSQKRTPETADLLLRIARNDPDKEVREQAVFWLSQVSDERAVDMLQEILRSSNDEGLQNKALFALSQHRSGRGAAILREFAERDGTSEELRGQAIFWLGQRSSAENNTFLRSLYTRLKSDELKDKVIFSLSQRRGMGNEKWMMDIVTNPRESIEMRKKALFWAGQNGSVIPELIPFYDKLTEREMKEQMIFVLSQRKSDAATDKLFDIAKNDRDPELRKKAIFWLGQSRDPRVQQFLLDIINK